MMSLGVATLRAGAVAALSGLRRTVGSRRSAVDVEAACDTALQAELDARFAEADQDFEGALAALLAAKLRPVVHRRVPVVAVQPAPAPHTARVMFADGTVVIARGSRPGDLGVLAVHVLMHLPACLASCRSEGKLTQLEFELDPRRRLGAVAVGLDQSD